MSKEKEPDETPVARRHVDDFLTWYRRRAKCPQYVGFDDHWFHALQTLNLGEFRRGVAFVTQMAEPTYMDPQTFWRICKHERSPTTAAQIKALRESLKAKKETERC